MRIEKLRQGVIAASDLEAQVEYYTKVLGLPLQIRGGGRGVVRARAQRKLPPPAIAIFAAAI